MEIRSHNKLSNITVPMETRDRVSEARLVPEHLGSSIFSGCETPRPHKDSDDGPVPHSPWLLIHRTRQIKAHRPAGPGGSREWQDALLAFQGLSRRKHIHCPPQLQLNLQLIRALGFPWQLCRAVGEAPGSDGCQETTAGGTGEAGLVVAARRGALPPVLWEGHVGPQALSLADLTTPRITRFPRSAWNLKAALRVSCHLSGLTV